MEYPLITYAIIGITVFTSYRAFNDPYLKQRMMFNPFIVVRDKDYQRIVTSGLIHADYMHLLVNMWVLYMFGTSVEAYFQMLFGFAGGFLYALVYILGMVASHIPSLINHKDSPYYNSLGASGAVSAVLFAAILLNPLQGIGLIILPGIYIPGFIAGFLYLAYSQYMAKRGTDNIGHDAHFMGAVFGFVFTGLLKPALFMNFYYKVAGWFSSLI
ncbi:MAG: rhomboid family intramembrane serine protease [Chitinophagales bacterium]